MSVEALVVDLWFPYICDDSVTIMGSHEVLDCTGSSILKPVATDEVVCELVLRGVGGCAVHDGHDGVVIPIAIDFGHVAEIIARGRRARVVSLPVVLQRSSSEGKVCSFKQFGI